jgi:hypothetical protein
MLSHMAMFVGVFSVRSVLMVLDLWRRWEPSFDFRLALLLLLEGNGLSHVLVVPGSLYPPVEELHDPYARS